MDGNKETRQMKPEKIFLRTENNYDTNAASDESGLECKDPSLAQQSARDETDINVIVRKFGLTGQLPQGLRIPTYGDFDQIDDFRTALEMVTMAQHTFDQLPAELRVRFGNDPVRFVDFCEDPKNLEELRKLGLAITPVRATEPEKAPPEAPKEAPKAEKA